MNEKYNERQTSDLINEFIDLVEEISYRQKTTKEKVSYFTKQADDIAHEIESVSFDAYRGYYLAKSLQKQRMLRRIVKRDDSLFDSISYKSGNFKWENILNTCNKFKNIRQLNKQQIESDKEWSNYKKLGDITYEELEEEYCKKFGSLEDGMEKLKEKYYA